MCTHMEAIAAQNASPYPSTAPLLLNARTSLASNHAAHKVNEYATPASLNRLSDPPRPEAKAWS